MQQGVVQYKQMKNAANAEAEIKQVVTFWHSMGGVPQEALNAIVEAYNSSQDEVQVNAEFQGTYDESLTKFNSVAGTDSAPTMIQTFEIGTMSMINSGNIKPIQEFIDAEGYDMSGLEENIINYYIRWYNSIRCHLTHQHLLCITIKMLLKQLD